MHTDYILPRQGKDTDAGRPYAEERLLQGGSAMRYMGMPWGMWKLFEKSFTESLVSVIGFNEDTALRVKNSAQVEYRRIIASLPEFEKDDRFQMNIVSCAMLSAYYLSMPVKPDVTVMTEYYKKAMMTPAMKAFCRMGGKNKFSANDMKSMKQTAALKAADRNPYSWNMELHEYPDGSGYEARFTKCGICTLMKELGIPEVIPAMCRLDYTMSEAGGASEFVRQYTLASGGPYCDCGYKKKNI